MYIPEFIVGLLSGSAITMAVIIVLALWIDKKDRRRRMAILTESEKLKLKNMEICLLDESKGADKVKAKEALIRLDTLYEIKRQLNI